MRKEYNHKRISYGFSASHRKWQFRDTKGIGFQLLTPVPGGAESAHSVARLLDGSMKRTKGQSIDGAARTAINKLTSLRGDE